MRRIFSIVDFIPLPPLTLCETFPNIGGSSSNLSFSLPWRLCVQFFCSQKSNYRVAKIALQILIISLIKFFFDKLKFFFYIVEKKIALQ